MSIPMVKRANKAAKSSAIKFEDQKSEHSDPFSKAEPNHDPDASKILKMVTKN